MSEPMFPGGGATTAAPAAAEVSEPQGNRKVLLAVGGVVAALVLVVGGFMLMNSGSGDDGDTALVVPSAGSGAQAGGAPGPAASPAPVIKPASLTVAKRDPFAPLHPAAAPSQPASQPTAPAAGPTAPAGEPTPVVAPVTLEVKSIDATKDVATVSVDGKKYPGLKVNDSFGGHYTLYSVFNPQCVGILYGDQSVPVCLGKPVSVTP